MDPPVVEKNQTSEEPVETVGSEGVGPDAESILLDYKAEDRAGAYEIAEFKLWHGDTGRRPRGVFVLVPGYNGDGRGMANDPGWQNMANKFKFMIVACRFKGGSYHSNIPAGSGLALFDAIGHLGEKLGFEELEELPFVMWGHSAGGQFNYNFAQWRPEQVLTFVVNKGAYYTAERDKKIRGVPALFFIGMKDTEVRIKNITGIFMEGREKKAPWCLIREPQCGHGVGESKAFTRTYFDTIIPLRLPEGSDGLEEIRIDQGYTGDLETFEVTACTSADGDLEDSSSWLPTHELADQWKSIVAP